MFAAPPGRGWKTLIIEMLTYVLNQLFLNRTLMGITSGLPANVDPGNGFPFSCFKKQSPSFVTTIVHTSSGNK